MFSPYIFRRCFRPQHFGQLFPAQTRSFVTNVGIQRPMSLPSRRIQSFSPVIKSIGLSGLGIGLSIYFKAPIQCEPPADLASSSSQQFPQSSPSPPPESSVSLYELGFGTVAGICAGVFIKKGAKVVAFFLGGAFVLLQYLGSSSLLRVDWARMGRRFENLFYTTDATGAKKAPTVRTVWDWVVNFLTADFQPRASFLAGFVLGLRIG